MWFEIHIKLVFCCIIIRLISNNPLKIWINNTKILGQKSSKIWAKCCLGQFVFFGQIVNLGKKSLGKMSSWANCHIGHDVFGQNVTLGNISLGILKSWAFQLSIVGCVIQKRSYILSYQLMTHDVLKLLVDWNSLRICILQHLGH